MTSLKKKTVNFCDILSYLLGLAADLRENDNLITQNHDAYNRSRT